MTDAYHYPPDLFDLMVEALAKLNKAKKGVVLFLRGAGVDEPDLVEVERIVRTTPDLISKFEIARNVLTKVNERGDSGIFARREIIRRIVDFEDYSVCWPEDQLKARGLVAAIRETVNKKDSFTRMKQERDAEREQLQARRLAEKALALEKRAKIEAVASKLAALFGMNDNPQARGKLLEVVLNDLFRAYGIHVMEDFRRRALDTAIVVEQLDGVIEIDGAIYIVEMKWLNAPVGTSEFLPHLSRLFLRSDARGIFISSSGFTEPVVKECSTALALKTMVLCSLQEIVMLLQRQDDLTEFFKKKSRAAIIEKNPFFQVLS